MSDEDINTTLAYTKSPKLCKRTTFQEELKQAIAARLARQSSSECSDDCVGGESVSSGDVSDTSVDENSIEKTLNDFQISDNEEKNSPKLSFLKTKNLNSDMMKDEPSFSFINKEAMAPDGCEDMVANSLSEFQNQDQEIEKEKIKMKPKPRILPVKSTSSAENRSSLAADNSCTPSPRPRSVLRKHSHGKEKDGLGEDQGTALCKELEAHPAPAPLPRLNVRQLGAEREAFPEHLDPENLWLTSLSSSLKESLENSFSPGSGEKPFIKVSSGDVSDTSVDENSVEKTLNDFQISDNEEKNSPKLSFLKTKNLNSDMMKDEPSFSIINKEAMAPDGCEDMVANPSSEFQNQDQEIEKEKIKMKPKPRILPVKSTSSADNRSSLEAENHCTPSPRPRSVLRKHSHGEEKDGLGEDQGTALCKELEAHPAPAPLPRLNGRQLWAEREAFPEHLDPENLWLTSLSSSLKESLENSFSPGSGEKPFIKDQNEEFTENHNSLKSNKNQENSFLIDFINTAIEKSKESQMTTDELKEENEEAKPIMSDDLTVDPPLLKSQSMLIPTNATESAKKIIEDGNMKNKKSTNNRASSASSRLTTSEFLKNSSSIKRTPPKTTSSQYLGPLKVLDQKPSQKQNIEPDKADDIRAAVYQEWLEKKNMYLHEKNRIKRIESEKLRIQNEQKKAAKRQEALASFEAWKALKEKEAEKIATQKRLEENNKKKTEEENAARKVEAQQAFERWREKKKIEYLKEKNKKEKEYERAKKQKEEDTVAEKRKDDLTAVEKWNEKKEVLFKEKEKEKTNEIRKQLKRAEKKDKDKQAINEYEKCLEKKERQERIKQKQKKHHSFLENEALPPWSPPSRIVFSRGF